MATKRDYYDILGVGKSASDREIKQAYRKMAMQYHPDKNKTKEAEEKFKEINEAYEVVSDPKKRSAYDQFGHTAFTGAAGGGPFGGGQGGTYRQGPFTYYYSTGDNDFSTRGGDFGGFSDPFEIFEQFFGGGAGFARAKPAYSVAIDFMEAVDGVSKRVAIDGKTRDIKIPAGIDDGQRIRFDDFDVVVRVRSHPKLNREGYDIVSEEEISMAEAALGDIVEVETVDGRVKLRIPEGTQPGAIIRMREKGVKHLNGERRGDHYVRIKVTIPAKLSPRQKELLTEFEEERTKKSKWF